jgi:hypothetical protein
VSIACDQVRFGDVVEGVPFDIFARGVRDLVAWPEDPTDVGFLTYDRNGNGEVDDGSELFGNRTPLSSGAVAEHGFEALAELDDNGDSWIDAADWEYRRLRLWLDANRDGLSQEREIVPLRWLGIFSISIRYVETRRVDRYGNAFRYKATMKSAFCQGGRAWDVFPVVVQR